MSKGTIKYSQEFKSEFGNRWIGIDLVVNDDEDWDEKYAEAENKVNRWARGGVMEKYDPELICPPQTANVQLGGIRLYNSTPTPHFKEVSIPTIDPRAYDTAEKGIDNATKVSDLEFYVEAAEKYGLMDLYNEKLSSLKSTQ